MKSASLDEFNVVSHESCSTPIFEELKAKNFAADFEQIKKEISLRDKQDSEREIAPLAQAEDAILLDTTNLTIEQVVAEILRLAQA